MYYFISIFFFLLSLSNPSPLFPAGSSGSALVSAAGEGKHPEQLQLHRAGSQPRHSHRGGSQESRRKKKKNQGKPLRTFNWLCFMVAFAGAAGPEADERASDSTGPARLSRETATERSPGLSSKTTALHNTFISSQYSLRLISLSLARLHLYCFYSNNIFN